LYDSIRARLPLQALEQIAASAEVRLSIRLTTDERTAWLRALSGAINNSRQGTKMKYSLAGLGTDFTERASRV
jgi:hypothetical protein